jgi:hypothetical protein
MTLINLIRRAPFIQLTQKAHPPVYVRTSWNEDISFNTIKLHNFDIFICSAMRLEIILRTISFQFMLRLNE